MTSEEFKMIYILLFISFISPVFREYFGNCQMFIIYHSKVLVNKERSHFPLLGQIRIAKLIYCKCAEISANSES